MQLGLGQPVMNAGRVVGRAAILDARGRQLGAEVDLTELYQAMGASLVALHRARLHAVLFDAVGLGVVRTSSHVASFEQDGATVHIALTDRQRIETELLVGADGLHSNVRAQLVGDRAPVYSGYTSWRGVTPCDAIAAPQRITESWGRGERFGIVSIG